MSIIIHPDPVPLRVDESGTIRVGQTRITLDVLLDYSQQGVSPEQLASAEYFPTLSLSDVHGTLAYYHRHKAELDEYLRQRQEEADRLQKEIETANAPFLAQMKARLEMKQARKDTNSWSGSGAGAGRRVDEQSRPGHPGMGRYERPNPRERRS